MPSFFQVISACLKDFYQVPASVVQTLSALHALFALVVTSLNEAFRYASGVAEISPSKLIHSALAIAY
jgi:hypothetical protein